MKTLFKGKEETVKIMKPLSDKREYRRIVLENSLQVLLISDPETDKVLQFASISFNSHTTFDFVG